MSGLPPFFSNPKKTCGLAFYLLSTFLIVAAPFYNEDSLKIVKLERQDFTVRLNALLYQLKPWCIDKERVDFHKSAMNEVDLESYCACIVGKIDQNFEIDRVDLTSDRYRRTHPYVAIQLQLFRRHCFEETR